ncbi:hypothetical protein [Streptomyces sp. TRM68367]|uniref:hypothetical protein n=1 Tax=Streptomyces sp. TRM68367 TaxID=2758415 RepID=UPI00165CE305|nr:hypothetical protein [Streptomyces sp. TRM68367]MBC9728108.1 hypothetical protein [Streptomyces sp. TRM68367]
MTTEIAVSLSDDHLTRRQITLDSVKKLVAADFPLVALARSSSSPLKASRVVSPR